MDIQKGFECLKLSTSYMKGFIPLSLDSSSPSVQNYFSREVTSDHPVYPIKLLYFNTIQNEFVRVQTSHTTSEKVQIFKYKLINYLFYLVLTVHIVWHRYPNPFLKMPQH